jgi:hypothetical protein
MKISTVLLLFAYGTILLQVSVNDAMNNENLHRLLDKKRTSLEDSGTLSESEVVTTTDEVESDGESTYTSCGANELKDEELSENEKSENCSCAALEKVVVNFEFYNESFISKSISDFKEIDSEDGTVLEHKSDETVLEREAVLEFDLGEQKTKMIIDYDKLKQDFEFEITTDENDSNQKYTVRIGQNSRRPGEESNTEKNAKSDNTGMLEYKFNKELFVSYKKTDEDPKEFKLYKNGFLELEDPDKFHLYNPKKFVELYEKDPQQFKLDQKEADDLKQFIKEQEEKFLQIKNIYWILA